MPDAEIFQFPGGGQAERRVRSMVARMNATALRLLRISRELPPEMAGAALVAAAGAHILERTGNADGEELAIAEIRWALAARRHCRDNPPTPSTPPTNLSRKDQE